MIDAGKQTGATAAWSVVDRPHGIAVVVFDVPALAVNLLRRTHEEELFSLLDALERRSEVQAVVLLSGKSDCFIVGPDLELLGELRTVNDGIDRASAGQRLTDRVASLRFPVVAAIKGGCLSVGLELALACHSRIASNDPTTQLGLPDAGLGLSPCMGATQRLPRLIGVRRALELLLGGEAVGAERAFALGLVDAIVSPEQLLDTAVARALELARPEKNRQPARGLVRALVGRALDFENNAIGRRIRFAQDRRIIAEMSRGNHPAAERILEAVEAGRDRDARRGYWAEARAFGELVTSPQAAHLVYLHSAAADSNAKVHDWASQRATALQRIGVLGDGKRAPELATLALSRTAIPVLLELRGNGERKDARATVERGLEAYLATGRMNAQERDRALGRLSCSGNDSVRECDLVVEAAGEELGLVRQILLEVEERGRADAVFATTSMAWSVRHVAEVCRCPERVVGLHYGEPRASSALLEVVRHARSDKAALAACIELGVRQGQRVVVVEDAPGGYLPRLLGSLASEALQLLSEGVEPAALEAALRDWGFSESPLAVVDRHGAEHWADVVGAFARSLGARWTPPALLARLAILGRRGQAMARNQPPDGGTRRRLETAWRDWVGTKSRAVRRASEMAQRCALRLVDEAARCYGEGVLGSARDGDLAAVYGVGFPASRGGPFRYVDEVGAGEIVRRLERLTRERGQRFVPAPLLLWMAQGEGTFHGRSALPPGTAMPAAGS